MLDTRGRIPRIDRYREQMSLEQMDLVYHRDYVELSCSMSKALSHSWPNRVGSVPREKTQLGALDPPGFTMLWRLCRGRHPSWTSRSFLSFPFFLFSFFFLSLYPRPQEEKTPRVQRVYLPFRDAHCTLDEAIYRSRALPGQLRVASRCLVSPGTRPHYPSTLPIGYYHVMDSRNRWRDRCLLEPRLGSAVIIELSSFPSWPLGLPEKTEDFIEIVSASAKLLHLKKLEVWLVGQVLHRSKSRQCQFFTSKCL